MREPDKLHCDRCRATMDRGTETHRIVNRIVGYGRRGSRFTVATNVMLCPSCNRHYVLYYRIFLVTLIGLVVGMLTWIAKMR